MKTLLLQPESDGAIAQAGALLVSGQVVGIPTETVYGLGANALDGTAVQKIFAAKGRPSDNPLIVHIADLAQIYSLTTEVPEAALRLAEAYWPGPMTIILPKASCIPQEVSAGLDTVGIRLPSHPIARAVIRAAGVPIAAPSANLSGRPSTTTAAHVMEDMNGKIAAVVDGGSCAVGVESTVVSLTGETPRLLRPGGISLEQLEAVLGTVEVDRAIVQPIGEDVRVSAPGMKYRHYAPHAPVTVVCGNPERSADYIAAHLTNTCGIICFDEFSARFPAHFTQTIGQSNDYAAQAQAIFDALRTFDHTEVSAIWAQCPDDSGIGLAVANRLKKAAGFHVIEV
ncbi:MAG: threonylcarbamoyl-AMP synthase [Butyricicoccus pullicaecorum]|nr:threonylcarbamoyl-AMP synthase [Butyricicoccus pullicaecorum]